MLQKNYGANRTGKYRLNNDACLGKLHLERAREIQNICLGAAIPAPEDVGITAIMEAMLMIVPELRRRKPGQAALVQSHQRQVLYFCQVLHASAVTLRSAQALPSRHC